MNSAFGIDLGTTNSAIVWNDARRGFRTIGDPLDNDPIPSVVAIEIFTQEVEFGRAAKQQWLELLESGQYHLIESVKSCLDKNEFWPIGNGRFLEPEGVASELFGFLSRCAVRAAGREIDRVVVAVPVGMSIAKRAVLRRAAKAVGLDILALVSEPTAACIANLEEIRHCRYVTVFDWGGGTLDISVLEIRGDCLTELHTDGWDRAGDYIDLRFAEYLHQQIAMEKHIKKSFDEVAVHSQQSLINAAEVCKRKLQEQPADVIRLANYAGSIVQRAVAREDFNELVKPIAKEAVVRMLNCIEESGINLNEVGCLLLVGGTSKLLVLEQVLQRCWPHPNILRPPDAEWAIAKGASVLALNPGNYRLAENVGLRLADGSFHAIFPAATRLDQAQCTLSLGLVEDSRTASFIFETAKRDATQTQHIGELQTDAFGFRDEIIELRSRISDDLIFEATAGSKSKPHLSQTFSYENLRWMYELPRISH